MHCLETIVHRNAEHSGRVAANASARRETAVVFAIANAAPPVDVALANAYVAQRKAIAAAYGEAR